MQRVVFILWFISSVAYGQSHKLLSNLDSTYKSGNSIIENHSHTSFFKSGKGDIQIDIENLDQQLLNAALHFSINKLRVKKNKDSLTYDPSLEFLAYNCTKFYTSSKFKGASKGRDKYERVLYMASRSMGLKQNLITTNVAYTDILDVQSKKRIYKSRSRSHPGFYYMSGSKKNPATDEKVPVCTYNQLAQKVVDLFSKNANRLILLSSSFETSACYLHLDTYSLRGNRPPKFKVIQILAGKRLTLQKG